MKELVQMDSGVLNVTNLAIATKIIQKCVILGLGNVFVSRVGIVKIVLDLVLCSNGEKVVTICAIASIMLSVHQLMDLVFVHRAIKEKIVE